MHTHRCFLPPYVKIRTRSSILQGHRSLEASCHIQPSSGQSLERNPHVRRRFPEISIDWWTPPGTQGPAFPGQTFCGTHDVDGSRNDLEPEWVCAGQDHHVRAHLLSFPSQMYATLYIIVVASRSRVWIWIKYLEPVRTLRPLRLLSSNS